MGEGVGAELAACQLLAPAVCDWDPLRCGSCIDYLVRQGLVQQGGRASEEPLHGGRQKHRVQKPGQRRLDALEVGAPSLKQRVEGLDVLHVLEPRNRRRRREPPPPPKREGKEEEEEEEEEKEEQGGVLGREKWVRRAEKARA